MKLFGIRYSIFAVLYTPTAVNLYDVIIEKQSRPASSFTSYDVADDGSATISVRDMLTGVKDYYGNVYFSARKAGQTNYSIRQKNRQTVYGLCKGVSKRVYDIPFSPYRIP